eukprot:2931149-Alexandrium_andersonii.AAC.1
MSQHERPPSTARQARFCSVAVARARACGPSVTVCQRGRVLRQRSVRAAAPRCAWARAGVRVRV